MLKIGDFVNSFILFNSVSFLGAIVLQANNIINIFDESYTSDGFCVSNKKMPILLQTHSLCFYFDTLFSCALYYLINNVTVNKDPDKNKEILLPVKNQIPGLFLHGLGHLAMPYLIDTSQNFNGTLKGIDNNFGKFVTICITSGFWYFMMKSINSSGNLPHWKIHSAVNAILALYIVPTLFNFTHTQTSIIVTLTTSNLLKKNKDVYYDLASTIIGLPTAIMPWIEGMYCDNFAVWYGGHLIYDITLPISCIIYHRVCYYKALQENIESKRTD